ncbi:MAG: HDOD domain-containing protein [Myxococcota bacterium]
MSGQKSVLEVVDEQLTRDGTALPVFSPVAAQLQGMLTSGEVDINKVTRLISGDPSLSTELLRVANSSRYRGLEKITTVRDAMMRLGSREVAGLALLASQKGNFRSTAPRLQELMRALWRHSVACAMGCRWLARKCGCPDQADQAFLAGLLHDAGKLLLLRVLDEMIADESSDFSPTEGLMLELLDSLHAEKGEALLRKWEIPDHYVAIVRDHHSPDAPIEDPLMSVVRLVDQACHKVGIGMTSEPDLVLATLPETHALAVNEIVLAELEILLEDALQVA